MMAYDEKCLDVCT